MSRKKYTLKEAKRFQAKLGLTGSGFGTYPLEMILAHLNQEAHDGDTAGCDLLEGLIEVGAKITWLTR
jgi:hypothetical protein